MKRISISFIPKGPGEYTGTHGLYAAVSVISGGDKVHSVVTKELKGTGITPDPVSEYHVTLMYSMKKSPPADMVEMLLQNSEGAYSGTPVKFTYWDGHDKKGYLVLEIKSKDLFRRNKEWAAIGAKHSFDDYTAHITVANHLIGMKPANRVDIIKRLNAYLADHRTELIFGDETAVDIKD